MTAKMRGRCPECGHDGQLTANGRMRTHKPKRKDAPVGPSGNCDGGSGLPEDGSVYTEGQEPAQRPLTPVEQRVAAGLPPNPHRDPVPTDGSVTVGAERRLDPHCDQCNYDTHVCPGCGDDVPHGTVVCAKCQVDYADRPATEPVPLAEALSDWDREAAAFLEGDTPDAGDSADDEATEFLAGPAAGRREGPGNWFTSRYDGDCDGNGQDACGASYLEGEEIRANGQGGWQAMGCCGWKDEMPDEAEITAAEAVQANPAVTEDEWEAAQNVLARRDWYSERATDASTRPRRTRPKVPLKGGRYVMPHPDKPGKLFRGTRVTRFVEYPADHKALEEWSQRTVLRGVGIRPELGLKAKELDVKADKDFLNRLVGEAKAAAEADKRANLGTILHKHTEELDEGTRTLDDMPEQYRGDLRAYQETLAKYGYTMLPELVERTVGHVELGVMGTFDRIVLCPDGRYRVGDVKSGDLTYVKAEIEAQEAIYAHGFNAHGVAQWSGEGDKEDPATWTWVRPTGLDGKPIRVEEDYGIVFHLPQGKGYCVIYADVDLENGWETAQLAAVVRDHQRDARKITWSPADPPEPKDAEPVAPVMIPAPPAPAETRKHPLTREQRDAMAAADIAAQAGRFPVTPSPVLQAEMDRFDQQDAARRDALVQMATAAGYPSQETAAITPQTEEDPDTGVNMDVLASATFTLMGYIPPEPKPTTSPVLQEGVPEAAPQVPGATWEERWGKVSTKEEASSLWNEMLPFKAELGEAEFARLVGIGKARIAAGV